MDKEYVAQLMKQLEELKRKKAHKERKLQKLKGSSTKDLKREKSTRASHTSLQRETHQADESVPAEKNCERKSSGSVNDLNHEKSSDSYLNNDKGKSVNAKCHSFSFENHKLNKDIENHKLNKDIENHKLNKDIENHKLNKDIENHKFNKDNENHSDINTKNFIITPDEQQCIKGHNINKTTVDCLKKFSDLNDSMKQNNCKSSANDVFLKPAINEIKTDCEKFEKHNFSFLNDKLSYSREKSPIVVENVKIESVEQNITLLNDEVVKSVEKALPSSVKNQEVVHGAREVSSYLTDKVKHTNMPDDSVLASALDSAENFTRHDSSENERKLSNDSNKSLPNSKAKSSDILDDSLNLNMSFFMSADLFANEDNDKKDLNKDQNDNELCMKADKCFPSIEGDSKTNDPKLPYPDHSYLSTNGYKKNIDLFNFPKFSTPTEGNTQVEKDDDMPDVIEKSPEITDSAKKNILLNKVFNNVSSSMSKSDSPLLNFVLEKRLSSVLDAHYESPKKIISKAKISYSDNRDHFHKDVSNGNAYKKRKLFTEPNCIVSSVSKPEHKKFAADKDSDIVLFKASDELDLEMKYDGFDKVSPFDSSSNSCDSLKGSSKPLVTLVKNSCADVPSQISKTVDSLVSKVCDDASHCKPLMAESVIKDEERYNEICEESKMDSEVLVIPETEGLGLYFVKDTEDFLETSTLSESMRDFPVKENFLNVSSQSKLESPVVNNIVAAVKSSRSFQSIHQEEKIEFDIKTDDDNCLERTPRKVDEKVSNDTALAFENSLGLDTSFLEDDTQDLGNFKQVPYMNDVNEGERILSGEIKTDKESNLKFICSLSGSANEPVMNVEIILFNDVKYAVLQYKTYLCVWRQERKKQWIKIFNHQIEDMLSLVKISVSMDDDNLVIIMLLSKEGQYCLQFLIFERDARVIKLMENTHWLEERCSEDSILLCGLSGLMFAIAQNKEKPEVSIHAFISLKENPRLMTAVLGSTETRLCSLCKIDKLPNALLGISDSMLYVWHILEARLVTAVSLHPQDYIPIKECFWATVENGLIYFLTTCEEDKNHHICQLLAANLATGFCQSAMTYSTLPSTNKIKRIIKAAYQEPFLVVAHSEGAFIWSVMEEFCCAALPSTSNITSISISRDFDNWGLLAIGSKNGLINCYSLH